MVDEQLATTARLLKTTGTEGEAAREVYRSLIRGLSRGRSLKLLRRLEQQIGPSQTLTTICTELEELQRLSCPRCGVELIRKEMVPHLWQQHGLVLDGHRVREPWQLIEDWIADYRKDNNPAILDRCRNFAEFLDPPGGLFRVSRVFLSSGVDDPDARTTLLAEARHRRASLCPHCFAWVPAPQESPVRPLNVWRGRLSGGGYRVEVSEAGYVSRLDLVTPSGPVERTGEPERRLTRQGATVAFAGPLVVIALLIGFGVLNPGIPPIWPVAFVLLIALAIGLAIHRWWRWPIPLSQRALDHAWRDMVPRLHQNGFSLADSGFIAGLALTTCTRKPTVAPAEVLQKVVEVTENAVTNGAGAIEHLGALHRLLITRAALAGTDPLPLVVHHVGRCFEGKLSLAFAEQLLDEWECEWWTEAALARLRILLCDRAFEAGFEVSNLVEAGQAAPTLGAVLETEDADGLARLRLLWSMRAARPWDRCGEAITVFDIAADAGLSERHLLPHPDLLLLQPDAMGEDGKRAVPVLFTGRGVIFQDHVFHEMPERFEVVALLPPEVGFELFVNNETFLFRRDPEELADRLKRWFRFAFGEFGPRVQQVHGWRSPSVAATFRARETVACPECKRVVLPRCGQVGGVLKEGS